MLLLLLILGMNWRSSQNEQAAAIAGMVTMDFSQEQYTQIISRVSSRENEFGGLPAFGPAVYFLARSELIVADTVRAEKHFKLYLDDYGKDPLLTTGSYTGLGIIAESRGLHAEAGDYYRRASDSASTDFLRHSNAVHAGRSFLLANQPDRAVKILQPMLDGEEFSRQLAGEAALIVAQAEVILGRM